MKAIKSANDVPQSQKTTPLQLVAPTSHVLVVGGAGRERDPNGPGPSFEHRHIRLSHERLHRLTGLKRRRRLGVVSFRGAETTEARTWLRWWWSKFKMRKRSADRTLRRACHVGHRVDDFKPNLDVQRSTSIRNTSRTRRRKEIYSRRRSRLFTKRYVTLTSCIRGRLT